MPRPPKDRWVESLPGITYFKPAGIPLREMEEVRLGVEELEALRLKEMEGLDQNQAASRMNVSQSTFQRLLSSARQRVVDALVNGKAIRVEGGNYLVRPRAWTCVSCGHRWERGNRRGFSRCPSCGEEPFTPPGSGPGQGGPPPWGKRRGRRCRDLPGSPDSQE